MNDVIKYDFGGTRRLYNVLKDVFAGQQKFDTFLIVEKYQAGQIKQKDLEFLDVTYKKDGTLTQPSRAKIRKWLCYIPEYTCAMYPDPSEYGYFVIYE